MTLNYDILSSAERIILGLRALYLRHGYTQYRMGKFEEYDLYAKNRDFLISDNIITFTDTNGRLMALKPDVTLSIVKNQRDDPEGLLKLCYNENVYRVSRGTGCFREILQAGVECIGSVDSAVVGETLLLAAESLRLCDADFALELSHLDILRRFVNEFSPDAPVRREALKCVSGRNLHGLAGLAGETGVPEERAAALGELMRVYGPAGEALPRLEGLCAGRGLGAELEELRAAVSAFSGSGMESRVRLDFSAVSNMNYYNGILFAGFLNGIPGSVLTGGQYDRLMRKMGRRSRAVGFAVYLDQLERLTPGRDGDALC